MDNYIFSSPYSLIISYFILITNYSLGHCILMFKEMNSIFRDISNFFFQKILIGQLALIIILFPLVIFFENAKFIFILTFSINLIFFIIFLIDTFKKKFPLHLKKKILNKRPLEYYFLLSLILLYFLISSSPITDADSLDYHYGAAINILEYDKYLLNKEWFTLAQSGRGEVLIAYGLLFGAEQYGSLIQFSGLLSICGILINIAEKNQLFKTKYFLSLIVLTCPILLFLANTAKPQLFFSACLFVTLALIFKKDLKKKFLLIFLIINILIFVSMTGKFSFQLSGFLIWSLAIYRFANLKNIINLLFLSVISFIAIYIPYILWKWFEYGGNILLYFINPFPIHLPGYENFFETNRAPQGFGLKFPFHLVFTSSMSRITETLGLSSLLFINLILCKKKKESYQILFIIFLFVLIANLYSSPSARYFFEVILWTAFSLKFVNPNKKLIFLNFFYSLQFIFVLLILIYSVITFFPGSLTMSKYNFVKNNYANDYSSITWLKRSLKEKNVLVYARSIAHTNNYTSGIFLNFTDINEVNYYKDIIKNKKIEYYATFGTAPELKSFKNCLDGLYYMEENIGHTAFRNPFAKKNKLNGYIYKLNFDKLPTCSD